MNSTHTSPVERRETANSVHSIPAQFSERKKLTFPEAYEQVQGDEQGKWDVLVRRQDIVSKDGKLAFPLDPLGEYWEALTPTPWATAQFCAQLGIPTTYFRRCPTVLQDIQANYWLRPPHSAPETQEDRQSAADGFDFMPSVGRSWDGESDLMGHDEQDNRQSWLLRARHGTLRAVLSERYSPLDNPVLMKCLEAAWREQFRVDWFALDDETLHLRIVDPTLVQEGLPGDDLMAGVHISNSEVGKRAVTVDAMIFRLICSNGLVRQVSGKSLLRQRHIHLNQERFHEQLEGAIREGLTLAAGFISQFVLTARHPVFDAEATLQRLGERWHLGQDVQATALHSMEQEKPGQQESVYSLVNGLTRAAQDLSMDARYDLEILAGRLVEHGLPAWAQAAIPVQSFSLASITSTPATHESSTPDAVGLAQEMFKAKVVGSRP
jgi:hypothetical protein